MLWILEVCLLVNFVVTLTTFLLVSEPERIARFLMRRQVTGGWIDTRQMKAALSVVQTWGRWMWFFVVAWGLLTGFLVGLYWRGWLWRG